MFNLPLFLNIISRQVSMHAQKGYSGRSVCLSVGLLICLLIADLKGRCITIVETGTNAKKMI